MQAERFIEFVRRKGLVTYHEAYRMIHIYFPDFRDFEGILSGAINSGQLKIVNTANGIMLQAVTKPTAQIISITPDSLVA